MELDQERKSLKAIRDEKIQFLKRELNRLENIKPEDYILEGHGERETFDFTYGPLIPPEERTVEALINRDLAIGSLLSVPTMRKSGPFYRVAGIFKSNFDSMELAVRKVKIYLVYKRDYFGFIPSYYVFVERILDE